ncbi:hypothetical protein MHYP_G00284460 [Metynnis hypsauchen]
MVLVPVVSCPLPSLSSLRSPPRPVPAAPASRRISICPSLWTTTTIRWENPCKPLPPLLRAVDRPDLPITEVPLVFCVSETSTSPPSGVEECTLSSQLPPWSMA